MLCLVAQSCLTLCDPMDCSMPSYPVLHHLLELCSTHANRVGDVIQPAHPLPPLLLSSIFPSTRVFSMALCFRCPKYWSFSFSISLSNEYSGLISCRIAGLISLLSKGLSSTTAQRHQFFFVQPSLWSISHIHTTLMEKL